MVTVGKALPFHFITICLLQQSSSYPSKIALCVSRTLDPSFVVSSSSFQSPDFVFFFLLAPELCGNQRT